MIRAYFLYDSPNPNKSVFVDPFLKVFTHAEGFRINSLLLDAKGSLNLRTS